MSRIDRRELAATVAGLDAWLDSMRGTAGYGGPVSHWWESSVVYCGPKIDWRYEGIIAGYVNLFDAAGDNVWLERATRAAADVVAAQTGSGNFMNSSFQQGPIEGGTPHEAAVCVGLLELAKRLRQLEDGRASVYEEAAMFNLHAYHLQKLWCGRGFQDQPWNDTLVANKNATVLEALLLATSLGKAVPEAVVATTADFVMSAQVHDQSRPYHGGTVHLGTGKHRLVIGIYTARCTSALLRLYEALPNRRYLESAIAMGRYLASLITTDGTCFGHYQNGRVITHPTWISPSGDIQRAMILLRPHVEFAEAAVDRLTELLIASRYPSGGLPTARGLGRKGATGALTASADFRDVLPVVGWCDKAFRSLTMLVDSPVASQTSPQATHAACVFRGSAAYYTEDSTSMSVEESGTNRQLYHFKKGQPFATLVLTN